MGFLAWIVIATIGAIAVVLLVSMLTGSRGLRRAG